MKIWINLILILVFCFLSGDGLAQDIIFSPAENFGAGNGSFDVSTGDFDNDGDIDLAIVNTHDGHASILILNSANFT